MSQLRLIGRVLGEAVSDLRYGIRSWRRQPGLVAVAVVSLAGGIGLNTAVFSIINTIFFQSVRGVPEPERVARIGGRSTYTVFREIRDNSTTLSGVAAWQPLGIDVRIRGMAVRSAVPVVSDSYFEVLRVEPARGRFFAATRTSRPAPVAEAVLDYDFWTRMLDADESLLGTTILLNGRPATLVGVAPRSFHGFGPVRPPLWVSMDMKPALTATVSDWEAPTESGWRIVGRLAPGTTVAHVNAELRVLAARSLDRFSGETPVAATGAERWRGPVSPEKRIEFLLVVVLPLVVVGLILWIGCSNVANLLLARASARRREIAIRLANGATRWRMIRMLLTESLALAFAGGMAGILIAVWTLRFVWATLPDAPHVAAELDVNVLLYTGFICVLATVFFGVAPALHGTRVDVSPLLKGEGTTHGESRRGARIRRFFLVTQFACSMALLIVAGTFVRSLVATYVGPESAVIDHVTMAYLETGETSTAGRQAYWGSVREAVIRLPHVESMTLMQPHAQTRMRLASDGMPASADAAEFVVQAVDSGYVRTSGIRIVAGRADLEEFVGGHEGVLLNVRAARRVWGTTDALGKRFALDRARDLEVAGVVEDDGREARVFRRIRDEQLAAATVMVRSSAPAVSVVSELRTTLLRLSSDRDVLRVSTMRDAMVGPLQRLTRMAVAVAMLVLALATVGLYGSVSFATAQRTREIAIRIAIGASRPAVWRLLGREGVLVVAGGALLGFAFTGLGFQFMSGMIFAEWTLDPLTIGGVLLVFTAVTLAACYVPGRRAMRIEPMLVLKSE